MASQPAKRFIMIYGLCKMVYNEKTNYGLKLKLKIPEIELFAHVFCRKAAIQRNLGLAKVKVRSLETRNLSWKGQEPTNIEERGMGARNLTRIGLEPKSAISI